MKNFQEKCIFPALQIYLYYIGSLLLDDYVSLLRSISFSLKSVGKGMESFWIGQEFYLYKIFF